MFGTWLDYDFPYIENVIIPTDFHSIIFQFLISHARWWISITRGALRWLLLSWGLASAWEWDWLSPQRTSRSAFFVNRAEQLLKASVKRCFISVPSWKAMIQSDDYFKSWGQITGKNTPFYVVNGIHSYGINLKTRGTRMLQVALLLYDLSSDGDGSSFLWKLPHD